MGNPTPVEGTRQRDFRVYFDAILATFAAVMIGYDSAFIGTSLALPTFSEEFQLVSKTVSERNDISSNIVSLFQAGCFFGAIFGFPLGLLAGRKWGLMISSGVFCIGAALQTSASSSTGLRLIYAGRVMSGLGIGVASNLAPIYVAEIAPARIRGRLVGLYELGWQIGGVIGFWINYGVVKNGIQGRSQWLIAFAVQLIPGGLLFIGTMFITESPRWLLSRGREREALRNLAVLRGVPEHAPVLLEEYVSIKHAIDQMQSVGGDRIWDPIRIVFRSSQLRIRLLIGMSLFAWQNATGINAINYYSPTIFKSIGLTGTNSSLLTTGVYGIIKLIGAFVWLLYLVDTFGRRQILMIGSIGGALSMYYIGAYIKIAKPADHPTTSLTSGGISAVAFFYIWTVFYSPSWNGTPWVHVRTFTQACMAASNWLFGFLIARFTPQMFTAMGYGVYMLFASLMVISIFYIYLVLPETKQIPLEYIDDLFAPGLRPWNAHDVVARRVEDSKMLDLSQTCKTSN
ncbi:general substrate transporter [Infundibulicybe gibba]|nr:general substrate transporter [Infundibulicybe gibba]